MRAVADLVRSDAVFSAEVLRLANSAILQMRYEVVSILHAVSVLGMEKLRALVLTIGMRDVLRGSRQAGLIKICWRHNLATALACELLADAWWLDRSLAYTAGLLHDIGRLALVITNPPRYMELLRETAGDEAALVLSERRVFGMDSAEAAQWLWDEWNLPLSLRDSSQSHHHPALTPGSVESLVAFGCEAADLAGFSVSGPAQVWNADELQSRLPQQQSPLSAAIVAELGELLPYKINLFECEFLG